MKQKLSVLISSLMVLSLLLGAFSTLIFSEELSLDIASVSVSSQANSSWKGANAIDGSTSTGWASNEDQHQWIVLNLSERSDVGGINIVPRTLNSKVYAFPCDFTIQLSEDGENWTTVFSATDYTATVDTQKFTFKTVKGVNYVKIDSTKQTVDNVNGYHCMFMEIEIIGNTHSYESKDITSPSTLTASSSVSGWCLSKLTDGSLTTGWASNSDQHQWFIIDLGTYAEVDRLDLYPRSLNDIIYCFPKNFTIQVSSDGVSWKTVVTETDFTPSGIEMQSFSFDSETYIRYIKLDSTLQTVDNTNNYHCIKNIDLIPLPANDAEKITYPALPEGYSISVCESSDETAVALDGTISR